MHNLFYFLVSFTFIVNISLAFMPYWTRKTENFGVSIPESMYFRADFKKMRKVYTRRLITINIVAFLAVILSSLYFEENIVVIFFIVVLITCVILTFLLYIPFHFQMKKIKLKENWHETFKQTVVIDSAFREEKITYSNYWFLIPTIITFFTIAFTWIVYDDMPTQVPTHTSITGEVTYDDKSPGNVLMLPVTQLFLLGIFVAINYMIKQSKQQISSTNPKVSKQQNIIFRRRSSLFILMTATLITSMFLFMQLTMVYHSLLLYQDYVIFSVIGIILFGTIILSVTTGQGGSRVKVPYDEGQAQIERDDDRYWKLGQFYVNKNDPSLFVEKRFGIGWTNNWAHPASWLIILVILGLAIGLPIFLSIF